MCSPGFESGMHWRLLTQSRGPSENTVSSLSRPSENQERDGKLRTAFPIEFMNHDCDGAAQCQR